jgi:hypothetical protein
MKTFKKAFNVKKQQYRCIMPDSEIVFLDEHHVELNNCYSDDKIEPLNYRLYFLRWFFWITEIKLNEILDKFKIAKKEKIQQKILKRLIHADDEDVVFLFEISDSTKLNHFDVLDMCQLLILKGEIVYKPSKRRLVGKMMFNGYSITDSGRMAFHDDKYIKEAKEISHQTRSRRWAFVNGPILLICAVISVGVAIYQVDRNEAIEKSVKQLDTATRLLNNRVFEMEISNLRTPPLQESN